MSAPRIQDKWIKIISTHGNLRGVALQATEVVRETALRHDLKGDVAQMFGEALMGATLIGSYCKSGERINLNIQAKGGIISQALIDAHPDGSVRGYAIERKFQPGETSATENMGPWGDGVLSVLRTKTAEHEKPYIGTVPLLTGYLAKDLTFYWVQSEQVPSAVGLAVNVDEKTGEVTSAGGFLVQALPGASLEEIRMIEQHINEIQSLANAISQEADPMRLLGQIFQSTAFMVLEEKPLRFECNCSWQRVERALSLVGVKELQNMLAEDNQASVRCDFCAKEYVVDAQKLQSMIEQANLL
jgi:molecular chaperone Hsp33